jgi:hypothetical protein
LANIDRDIIGACELTCDPSGRLRCRLPLILDTIYRNNAAIT